MKWEAINLDEQETLIIYDYYEKVVSIYTSRSIVYNKILKKIGQPTKTNINFGKIYSAEWIIPFQDRKKIQHAITLANMLMVKKS